MSRASSVDEVLELMHAYGHDHYGEGLSQLEHALQTATLAERAGASDELVVAALLHDVGHLLDLRAGRTVEEGTRHEHRGARYLAGLFPAAVTAPIALHVAAKRYRCAVDPDYLSNLSEASQRSLQDQGGAFDADEVAAFDRVPGAPAALALRAWDDAGKDTDIEPGDADLRLEAHRARLERLALAKRQPG